MSNKNYTLSNKIRTILLTTIDKEILKSIKKNDLLINSQNKEQLMKKYINYEDFTIKNEESFGGVQNNEKNNIFVHLSCKFSDNKYRYFCYSSRTNNELSFHQNFITKSFSPKKKYVNSGINKIKKTIESEDNLCKLNKESENKLTTEMGSSFSCKESADFNNSLSVSNDNNFTRKFSDDLNFYDVDRKSDDSSKLINYCYQLKKPNNGIINEKSDDDTSTNKESEKNLLKFHRINNKHKNAHKKRLKKTLNKKMIDNKNNIRNDDQLQFLIFPTKKKSTNFTSQMKVYFNYVEKSNPKEKMKIQQTDKKLSNVDLKKTNTFYWKNILELHHCNSKSPENKSKGKKLKHPRRSFCINRINKKPVHKKSQNIIHFKSFDNTSIISKNKEEKKREVKSEKKDDSISGDENINSKFLKKHNKSSRTLYKNCDEFKQN